VILLFTILWILRPISYEEMRNIHHPLQENAVLANSSSILTKTNSNGNCSPNLFSNPTPEVMNYHLVYPPKIKKRRNFKKSSNTK